jgi:hypothetical protein
MGLIIQPARLALCKCGQHGVIAFGDGSKSEEFFSKENVLGEVQTAILSKKIISAEAEFLRQAIADSAILMESEVNDLRDTVMAFGSFTLPESEQEAQPPGGHTLH